MLALKEMKEQSENAGLRIWKKLRSWHLVPSLHDKQKRKKWKPTAEDVKNRTSRAASWWLMACCAAVIKSSAQTLNSRRSISSSSGLPSSQALPKCPLCTSSPPGPLSSVAVILLSGCILSTPPLSAGADYSDRKQPWAQVHGRRLWAGSLWPTLPPSIYITTHLSHE